jgi:hypothetical protein
MFTDGAGMPASEDSKACCQSGDMMHNNITFEAPFLNRKVLDIDMALTRSLVAVVDDGNDSKVVYSLQRGVGLS